MKIHIGNLNNLRAALASASALANGSLINAANKAIVKEAEAVKRESLGLPRNEDEYLAQLQLENLAAVFDE